MYNVSKLGPPQVVQVMLYEGKIWRVSDFKGLVQGVVLCARTISAICLPLGSNAITRQEEYMAIHRLPFVLVR